MRKLLNQPVGTRLGLSIMIAVYVICMIILAISIN